MPTWPLISIDGFDRGWTAGPDIIVESAISRTNIGADRGPASWTKTD
jgi:hypothetical protein